MHAMIDIRPFREIANIGKDILVRLTEQTAATYTTKTVRNYSKCDTNCQFYSLKTGPQLYPNNKYCKEFCTKVVEKIAIPIIPSYKNQEMMKNIPGEPGKFTHSQIIQFLYMHFLPGKGGIRSHVSISQTATDLGLCSKTVATNLQKFIFEDLIYATKIDSDTYSVYLKDVKNYHLTKEQGGTGYIPVTKELLSELITIKNVNSLKLEIRKLLKYDSLRISRDSTKKGAMSFKDMRRFLPSHINYKHVINKVIDGASNIFKLNKDKDNSKIEFELKSSYDARVIREERKLNYSLDFAVIFNQNALSEIDKQTELEDLVQMSFEYGHETVLTAFKKYLNEYWWNNIVINNIGAFVRSLIQKAIVNEISLV